METKLKYTVQQDATVYYETKCVSNEVPTEFLYGIKTSEN
jgi:hypothetical protein